MINYYITTQDLNSAHHGLDMCIRWCKEAKIKNAKVNRVNMTIQVGRVTFWFVTEHMIKRGFLDGRRSFKEVSLTDIKDFLKFK